MNPSSPENPIEKLHDTLDREGVALQLVEYPHPALRRVTRPLARIDSDLLSDVEEMFHIMYDAGGIGLAANQVALPYRLFIVNLDANPDEGEELVFVNPSVSRPKGTSIQEEGCLSLPGLRMPVRRPERIILDAYSLEGTPIHLELDGMLARAVQHECDHLEGRLFTDRLGDAATIEVKRSLETFEEVSFGKQSRGELPSTEKMVARLIALEQERCTS